MKSNRPYFPCQTEDGRTFVMQGVRIVREIPGFETTVRWRTAQELANKLNDDFNRGRMTRRDRIAIVLSLILTAIPLFDAFSGGDLSNAVIDWIGK